MKTIEEIADEIAEWLTPSGVSGPNPPPFDVPRVRVVKQTAAKLVAMLEPIQSELTALRAQLAAVEGERETRCGRNATRYIALGNAEYEGACHARRGGKIEDCPYGPMKADGFRDPELKGCWQRGFDTANNPVVIATSAALFKAGNATLPDFALLAGFGVNALDAALAAKEPEHE